MGHIYLSRKMTGRLSVILLTTVGYFLLLVFASQYVFVRSPARSIDWFSFWLTLGVFALIGVFFLAVAALAWLYARDRLVAGLLFVFSCSMAAFFAVLIGPAEGNDKLDLLASVFSALSIPFLAALTFLFPKNLFTKSGKTSLPIIKSQNRHFLLLYAYLALLSLSCIVVVALIVFEIFTANHLPAWVQVGHAFYYLLGLGGALAAVITAYLQSTSLRVRQQIRLFVVGVIVSIAPSLFLTVLPAFLNLPTQYIVQGEYSALSLAAFPLTLGYSLLRYQLLIFDRYVRRAVSSMMGIISLLALVYLAVAASDLLFPIGGALCRVFVAGLTVVLAPVVWWLAHVTTERLFFSEITHYRRIIEKPSLLDDEVLDVEEAARLLTVAVVHTFETPQSCLFVLDESDGHYILTPPLKANPVDDSRYALAREVSQALGHAEEGDCISWLGTQLPAMERLEQARRPQLLWEVARDEEPNGLARYIAPSVPQPGEHVLLAPVRARGKMIGLLVLGPRGDGEAYAGPDFGFVQMLLSRFSSIIENARLYARASQYAILLEYLSGVGSLFGYKVQSIDKVASVYVDIAATATRGEAEIWLYDEREQVLRCASACGEGPHITHEELLRPATAQDWSPWFCDTQRKCVDSTPPCLPRLPDYAFAWLPLLKNERRVGIFVLTYARPHFFLKEEERVLEVFTIQCASALENARMALELQAAYEYQKELDQLKDQFIATVSHELRTPLTAVQGYIELLREHGATLTPELWMSFISKASLGCDELALMVNNIMEASRVHIDAEQAILTEQQLSDQIAHVMQILDSVVKREQREVVLSVPDNCYVLADRVRVRQVLLNLLSNALKYSPVGSKVELTTESGDTYVTVRVRDQGLGVPLEDQHYLFERFIRLERDVNSTVRGAGLGLYICRQLVQAMGGRIWVESSGQPGEGSIFAFTLKLAPRSQVTSSSAAVDISRR